MGGLAAAVNAELRTRRSRAIALGDDDAALWLALTELASLHRPVSAAPRGQHLRCQQCKQAGFDPDWPCLTLSLLAEGLGVTWSESSLVTGQTEPPFREENA